MEENKENIAAEKMTYEQLEQAAMQLQQRLMIAENKLRSIDFASMRLTWLFKVIENGKAFDKEFCDKCVSEINELLTLEEPSEEEADKV